MGPRGHFFTCISSAFYRRIKTAGPDIFQSKFKFIIGTFILYVLPLVFKYVKMTGLTFTTHC